MGLLDTESNQSFLVWRSLPSFDASSRANASPSRSAERNQQRTPVCFRRLLRFAAILSLLGFAASTPSSAAEPITIEPSPRTDPVSFEGEILPILRKNCLACHSASEEQGGLVLESPQTILQGGDAGPAVVPGKGEASLMLTLASHQDDPVMPPAENDVAASNLTPAELGLLKLWIDQGAKGNGGIDSLSPKQWQPLPAGVHPVLAIALTQDGQLLACGRANQIFLYHVPTGQLVTKLSDPSLDTEAATGISHRDLVQSLALNADGDLLASGGFREVKLWRRPRDVQPWKINLDAAATAVAASPDRRWIAVASVDHQIRLFDAQAGKPGASLIGHTDTISSLRFSPDSAQLISGSHDHTVRIWKIADGTMSGIMETPAAINDVELVSRENGGDQNPVPPLHLATGDEENLIRIWQLPQGLPEKVSSSQQTLSKTTTSPDGQWMAMVEDQRIIRVVAINARNDQPLGKTLATWQCPNEVTSLAFAPQTASTEGVPAFSLLTGDDQGRIRLWRLPDHALIAEWTGEATPVTSLAVSSDGNFAASGLESGLITLWKMKAAEDTVAGFAEAAGAPIEIRTVSPSRKLVAYAGRSNDSPAIFVRNLESGELTATLLDHESEIKAIAFSGDETRVVAGSQDSMIYAWDLQNPEKGAVGRFQAEGKLTAVGTNHTGTQITVGFADHALRLYNAIEGEPAEEIKLAQELTGNEGAVLACGYVRDQPYSISADKSVRFWNLADGSQTRAFNLPAVPTASMCSSDGNRIVVCGEDNLIRIVQTDNGSVLATTTAVAGGVNSLDLSPDSQQLAILDGDGKICVFDVATGVLQESIQTANTTSICYSNDATSLLRGDRDGHMTRLPLRFSLWVKGAENAITDMLFHSNGQSLFIVDTDGRFRGFNTQNGQQLFATNHGAAVYDLAISSNEQILATAGENGTVRLWQSNGNAYGPQQLTGFSGPVHTVGFSVDSKQLFAGSTVKATEGQNPEEKTTRVGLSVIRMHDVQTGMLLQEFSRPDDPIVSSMALSIDAADAGSQPSITLLAGFSSGLYRFQSGFVRQLSGHTRPVTSLSADPSRPNHVYSGSLDGTMRLWNLDNGQAVRQVNHGGPITSIAVSPDGERLASTSENATAKLFLSRNGQQIAEMRGDIRLKVKQARAQQNVNSLNGRLNVAKRLFDDAEKDVPKKTEAEKKLADGLAESNQGVSEKQQMLDQAMAEKATAERLAIEASTAARKAIGEQAQAELLAEAATKAVQSAQQKVNQLQQALSANPENEELQQLISVAQQDAVALQEASEAASSAVTEPTKKAQEMAKAANAAAQKVGEVQKPFDDAAKELKAAQSEQNLLAQQHALAAKELQEAQDLVPVRKESLARAETEKADADRALELANEAWKTSEKPLRSIAFSPDGAVLVSSGDDSCFHTWDGQTGEAIAAFAGHVDQVEGVVFLDQELMVSVSNDKSCRAWEQNPSWMLEKTLGSKDDPSLISHRATAVDFNPESTQLLVASGVPSRNGELLVFDLQDASIAMRLPQAHDDVIYSAKFSPDGKRIASVGADKYLRTFDLTTRSPLRRFEGHTNYVLGVSWKSDGEMIATSSADNTIKLWEAETGDQRRTINQQLTKHVTSVQFIGDTENVISSSGDKRVRIHNGNNGGVARSFGEVQGWLHCVAVTPDSKLVAAGDADGTVTIWNGTNGQLIHTLAVE